MSSSMPSSPTRIHAFAAHLANIVSRLDRDPEAFEMLTQGLDDPKFPKLLPKFQKIMYSHAILGVIAKEDYVKASEYLSTVDALPGDDFLEHFHTLRMTVLVREEMLKIASTPLFEKGSAEEIGHKCQFLMTFITMDHSEEYFRQTLGVIHYNLALSLAIQKNLDAAIDELRTAQAILSEPIDRIVQARVKCGLAFLANLHLERCPSPSNFASELTPEERATPDFGNEFTKWVRISAAFSRTSSSPSPE